MRKRDLVTIFFVGLGLVAVVWIVGLVLQEEPVQQTKQEITPEERERKVELLQALRGATGERQGSGRSAEEKMNLLQSLRGR